MYTRYTRYTCALCAAPVEVRDVDGAVLFTRTCAHSEAAILAEMEATVYGEGGAQ